VNSTIVSQVSLTTSEIDFIKTKILGYALPWHRNPAQTYTEPDEKFKGRAGNTFWFSHPLMDRAEKPYWDPDQSGKIVDPSLYSFFHVIFSRHLREQNIEYKTILRSSLNLVVHSNYEFTVPHVDHFFPHWNWVMYLNTVENAPTVLFDENMEIIESVQAEEFKSVIFPGVTHAHKFPPINQDRCVCVFTFA